MSPLPDSYDPALTRLRADLVSDQVGIWMTSRALGRIFASGAWICLAVAYADPADVLWGLPLLVGGVASWLQAGALFLRPPTAPRLFDAARLLDVVGLALAAAATGHRVDVFDRRDAALVATTLVLAAAVPTVANLVAHPSFARYDGPPLFWVSRRVISLLIGPLTAVLLWPAQVEGPGVALVVVGAILLTGSGLRWAWHLDRTEEAVRDGLRAAHLAAVRDIFFSLHGGLRNPARSVLSAVAREQRAARDLEHALALLPPEQLQSLAEWRRSDLGARKLTLELLTRISEFVEMARNGRSERPRSAKDVVTAILAYHRATRHGMTSTVTRQLDPLTLSSLDNEYVAMCLTELVTNAVVAQAQNIEVSVDAEDDGTGTTISVEVTCTCEEEVSPGRPVTGTLGLIADEIELSNGSFLVTGRADGSHTMTARWPTDARPRPLP